MIVREILKDPKLLENFDFFNDYDDTARWLRGLATTDAAQRAFELRARHQTWIDRVNRNAATAQHTPGPGWARTACTAIAKAKGVQHG